MIARETSTWIEIDQSAAEAPRVAVKQPVITLRRRQKDEHWMGLQTTRAWKIEKLRHVDMHELKPATLPGRVRHTPLQVNAQMLVPLSSVSGQSAEPRARVMPVEKPACDGLLIR